MFIVGGLMRDGIRCRIALYPSSHLSFAYSRSSAETWILRRVFVRLFLISISAILISSTAIATPNVIVVLTDDQDGTGSISHMPKALSLHVARSEFAPAARSLSAEGGPIRNEARTQPVLPSHRFHRGFQSLSQIVRIHDGQKFDLRIDAVAGVILISL